MANPAGVTARDFEILAAMSDDERARIDSVVDEFVNDQLMTVEAGILLAAAAAFERVVPQYDSAKGLEARQIAAVLRLRAMPTDAIRYLN